MIKVPRSFLPHTSQRLLPREMLQTSYCRLSYWTGPLSKLHPPGVYILTFIDRPWRGSIEFLVSSASAAVRNTGHVNVFGFKRAKSL